MSDDGPQVTKRTYDDWDAILYHLPRTPDGDRVAEIIRKEIHAPTVVSSYRTLIPIELSESDTEMAIAAEMAHQDAEADDDWDPDLPDDDGA